MEDKHYEKIKELIQSIRETGKEELEESSELIDVIIKNKITNERAISSIFDKMLSIEFIEEDELKETYYRLLKYCKKFNKKLSDDYEQFFIEKFDDSEEIGEYD